MKSYYFALVFMTVCIAGIGLVMVRGNATLPRREKRLFWTMFAGIIVAALCECLAVALNGNPALAPLICLAKTVEFVLAPSVSVVFAAVLERRETKLLRAAVALLILHAVLECALAPFGLVFYVNARGVYCHGSLYGLYVAAYIASAALLMVSAGRFSRGFQYQDRLIPTLVLAFALSCVVLQMVLDGIRITWLSLALCGVVFYNFYCSVVQQTDALTLLLNRQCFESSLSYLNVRAAVVYFDVDDFKDINDLYGHDQGDLCLRLVGRCIANVFRAYGNCYRIGGDEFCAILTKGMDQKEQILERFHAELAQVRATQMDVLPHVSIGWASFDPYRDDTDMVCKVADQLMYEEKRRRKVGRQSNATGTSRA